MSTRGLLRTGFAALIIFSATTAFAADETKKATDAPATETKTDAPAPRGGRLIKPYSELKDLSPEQTAKIKEIHAKFLAEKKAIDAKEKEACMALLSDDQKKEVAELGAKSTVDKKTAAAATKTEKTASESGAK